MQTECAAGTQACGNCGKPFTPTKRQLKRQRAGSRICCSTECVKQVVGPARKPPLEFGPCPTCGKTFRSNRPKRFCSMRCYTASPQFKETRLAASKKGIEAQKGAGYEVAAKRCPQCGKSFAAKPSGKKHCSNSCRRRFFAERYDRWIATPQAIALPQGYDEFLAQAELSCLVEGCDWSGQNLSNHMNFAHGIPAADFKRMAGFSPATGVVGAVARAALEARPHIHNAVPPSSPPVPTSGRRVSLEGKEQAAKRRAEKASIHVCITCSSTFVSMATSKSGARAPRFCSSKCKSAWHAKNSPPSVTMECAWCQREFVSTNYDQIGRWKNSIAVVCGIQCRNSLNGAKRRKAAT